MTFKVAINGYGRIGRNILRAFYEAKHNYNMEIAVVAINDLAKVETNAHLTRYDSVHGRFDYEVTTDGTDMVIDGDHIKIVSERNPQNLPWAELGVDLVLECTGLFTTAEQAEMHLKAGAKKVLISAPAGKDVKTIVYGVNQDDLKPSDRIISNASCTTNCLAPMAKVLHEKIGIERGLMVTIHSYTNDQRLTDSYHSDLRRARAATMSIIPTKTGAAAAVGMVLPQLAGKLDGYAMRVPTANVSVVDLTFDARRDTTAEEINALMKQAAAGELKGVFERKGVIGYTEEPLVSIDFNHDSRSCIFDATETRVIERMAKVVAWYDNEWGFSNRMLDTAHAMLTVK